MTRGVKASCAFLTLSGVILLLGSVAAFFTNFAKWQDWLTFFGGACLCFKLVYQVRKGQGDWMDTVPRLPLFANKQDVEKEKEDDGRTKLTV